jgi:cytochrome c-type biogenesis protein CcmE
MNKKIGIPVIFALVVAMLFSTPVFAAAPAQTGADVDPGRPLRAGGIIVSVDTQSSTLVLKPRQGAELTLTADEKTRYAGAAQSLEDIEAGMIGAVFAHREEGDVMRLIAIFTRVPLERYRGQVESVDAESGTLTLITRQEETISFKVDDHTRYKGYQLTVESLEDVQPGMWAAIVALPSEDGSLLARGILAAQAESLPKLNVRMGGKVIAVDEDSFTIENRKGEEVTFQVDDTTRFRSRDGKVTGLEQLKEGMTVLVGGNTQEEGDFLAKGVLVVQRQP